MDQTKYVSLDELATWIGRAHDVVGVDEVSRNDIRRKLEVFCFDCPLHYDDAVARAHGYRGVVSPVSLTPLWAMPAYWSPGEPILFAPGLPQKPGGIRTELPPVYPRGVNVGSEWEYFEPLYPGDRLHGNWALAEIKPGQNRLGEGVFLTIETTLYKQTGELVSKNRNTGFRYPDKPSDAPREKRAPKPEANGGTAPEPPTATTEPADWSAQRRFAEVTVGEEVPTFSMWLNYQRIVMSVAADRMYSGIHHNRDQAREAGHKDIIYNTRSYEMQFETMLRRWIGLDGRITKLGPFRMSGSSYPDDVVTTRATVTGKRQDGGRGLVDLDVVAINNRGDAAKGKAQVALPT